MIDMPANHTYIERRRKSRRRMPRHLAMLIIALSPILAASQPVRFGSAINSDAHEEYAPLLIRGTAGFDTLIYTSSQMPPRGTRRTRQASMMFATRPSSDYGVRNIIDGWTDGGFYLVGDSSFASVTNGVVAIGRDRIIFAADRKLANGGIDTRLELYEMRRTSDGLGRLEAIASVNDPDAWDSQPSLSPDGRTLFFVSNRRGGSGGDDIWYSTLGADGEWSRARPMANINTAGSEFSPVVGPDGKLYFASDWDYARGLPGTRKHEISRADLAWKSGAPVPTNPANIDVVLERESCLDSAESQRLAINTPNDDEFPFLTADRTTLVYSSSRGESAKPDVLAAQLPGGCVRLCVSVTEQLQDSLGHSLSAPFASALPVLVVDRETSDTARSDGARCYYLRADHTYSVTPTAIADRNCFDVSAKGDSIAYVKAPRALRADTTLQLAFNIVRRRISIPDIVFSSTESIPFFITGYWWPNTTANLRAYRADSSRGVFNETGFIQSDDYPYDRTAREIDALFETKLYKPLEGVLPRFTAQCADTLALVVSVHGYTDPRRLTEPHVYPGETVTVGVDVNGDSVTIASGSIMTRARWIDSSATPRRSIELRDNGQLGNILLSKLRAHYTFATLDAVMRERSPIYRALAEQGRIRLDAEGYGQYREDNTVSDDDPLSRRIEIYMDAVPVSELRDFRRARGGDVVETGARARRMRAAGAKPVATIDSTILPINRPPVDSVVVTTSTNAGACYVIQFVSLRDSAMAQQKANTLINRGLDDAHLEIVREKSGGIYYRVRAGCYDRLDDALLAIDQYKSWLSDALDLAANPSVVQ